MNTEKLPIGEDTSPKDRVNLGMSPSATVLEWDLRKKVEASTLETIEYKGSKIEPIAGGDL